MNDCWVPHGTRTTDSLAYRLHALQPNPANRSHLYFQVKMNSYEKVAHSLGRLRDLPHIGVNGD